MINDSSEVEYLKNDKSGKAKSEKGQLLRGKI